VSAPEQSHQTATAALSAAEADLVELDQAERADWIVWSDAPEGPQPEPRHEARRCIEQRAALARADLRGAEAAVAAVQARLASLNGEMNQLAAEIYRHRLDAVLGELPDLEAEILDARDRHVQAMTRLRGIYEALGEEIATLRSIGELTRPIWLRRPCRRSSS
jgi:chromosome segregation ATPase